MRVLISGAGIAGPTLAYWLEHYGWKPTLVEAAPRLRTGGYILDFWGAGFDIAERMGLLPEIRSNGYRIHEVRVVNRDGRRTAGFPAEAFERMTQGRYVSISRGDLAASIFHSIDGRVETIFGDSVDRIEQTPESVQVTFAGGAVREFDLVVGADGLHSRIRELAFGPEHQFEDYLGYKAAAFEVEGYRPRDELAYVMYTEVGQQIVRFAMRGDRTMFLLTFVDPVAADPVVEDARDLASQKALLRKRFQSGEWEYPQILDALDAASTFYFDRVSQIRIGPQAESPQAGSWSRGRVTLVGDAASCPSLLAGQGSALAMVAAYILAGELHRAKGDYTLAFARYQNTFGPFVLGKQKAARRFAATFAPKSHLSLFVRNRIFNLLAVRWIADMAIGRDIADRIALPDYS